jgi:peptidoglycan DL-endopeptidase CwlO
VLLLLIAVIAGAVGGVTGQEVSACTAQPFASSAAASIPADYLADFKAAGTRYGIPWTVLAAIGEVESGFGADDGPSSMGPRPDAVRVAGLGAVRRRREHHGPGRRHPRRRPPPDRQRRARQPPAGAPRLQPLCVLRTDVLDEAARYAADGAQAVSAAGIAVCQQAALGPLHVGATAKILAYAEAQLGKPYVFSGGPSGEITLNPRVYPAQKADVTDSCGATGVVQATSDAEWRCVAAAVILYAAEQLGKPYQWGETGPDAFDCSGLAMMAYRAAGAAIPRTSQEQWAAGPRVPPGQEQPGDLVFFTGSDGTPQAPGHVGIAIGSGEMIEAYATGFPIRVSTYGQPSSPPGDQVVVGFTRPV